MAKGHVYAGNQVRTNRGQVFYETSAYRDLRYLAKSASKYFWTAYSVMGGNYVAIATIVVVVLLSFLLPDLSQKLHVSKEVKAMQQVLDCMSKDVDRAEAACLTAANEICYLQYTVRDDTTETNQDLRDFSVCTSSSIRQTRSEPMQVEKKIGFFRKIFFPNRNASHKEVAIMSYVYTNSFDAKKNR